MWRCIRGQLMVIRVQVKISPNSAFKRLEFSLYSPRIQHPFNPYNPCSNMFKVKTYGKSEFAWLMFPKMRDPRAAQDKLLRWIKKDPRFHKRLLRLANTKDDNDYSKEQIKLLIDKFGEPGEYDDY